MNKTGARHRRKCPACGALYYRDHSDTVSWGRSYKCPDCRDTVAEARVDHERDLEEHRRRDVAGVLVMTLPDVAPKTGPNRAATPAQISYLTRLYRDAGVDALTTRMGDAALTITLASAMIEEMVG